MYNDRGIIKWSPFDALKGYNDLIKMHEKKRNKIDKPILLEDKLEELDYILKEAYEFNQEVEIQYYEDGFIKYITGTINNIDVLNKKITVCNHFVFDVYDITNIIK